MAERFPVFMYHRLESASCPVAVEAERPWAVALAEFERQMRRLRESGRTGVSMDQIHRALGSGGQVPAEWVGITFDDGNASDYRHALPVLVDHGFRATFFVCGERIGTELSRVQLREMQGAGMHIGSHAMSHRFMTTLDAAQEEAELVQSRAALEAAVDAPVVHFAPPGGRWSRRTRAALERAGYVAVSTSRYGFNPADAENFAYCRLPVVRATSMSTFEAMVACRRLRLWPGYARAALAGAARRVMGEPLYARVRTPGKDR
jgi:peptidoglycan/xylan/chitin deacetylase (PgdA/CDA1 family)